MALTIPLNYPWIDDNPAIDPYYIFDNMYYPMRGVRCIHQIGARQCSRRSIFTIPMCWQHLQSDYHIIVDQTTLTDANGVRLSGRGLFACLSRPIAGQVDLVFVPGQTIVPYIGETVTHALHEARYPGDTIAPYSFPIANNRVVDAGPMRGVAALANDCRTQNRNRGDCEGNNARLVRGGAGNYPKLVATQPIFDGDEIFCDYGDEYWGGISRPFRTQSARNAYGKLKYKCGRR